jgi:hypothetical protein
MLLGTQIKQTLIHGAEKDEIKGLAKKAFWMINPHVRMQIIQAGSDLMVPPQAIAAHLIILYGDVAPSDKQVRDLSTSWRTNLIHLNFWRVEKMKDRLQVALFGAACHEGGLAVVSEAVRLAKGFEMDHGQEPVNYKNWIYVQDFLWAAMKDHKERSRSLIRFTWTLIEIMSMICNEFADDNSPEQKLVF